MNEAFVAQSTALIVTGGNASMNRGMARGLAAPASAFRLPSTTT